MKLGKHDATPKASDFKFTRYVDTEQVAQTLPSRFGFDHAAGPDWGMLGNDRYGDCVWAAACHEHMLWTARGATYGQPAIFDTADALQAYTAVTGFNPHDPSTDQGTNVHDALSYRRKTGIQDAGRSTHKILAYLSLDVGNLDQLWQALYLFEAVEIGIQFPISAMDQFNAGEPWSVVHGSRIEGGHDVVLVSRQGDDHAGQGQMRCLTWGALQSVTDDFLRTYCPAAEHRVLTADLRWVPAGDICVGDRLLAFDEHAGSSGRFYRESEVLRVEPAMESTHAVEIDGSDPIRTTPEHRWLTRTTHGWNWIETRRLRWGGQAQSRLTRIITPWADALSYDDGWLAGFLDGEGSIDQPRQRLAQGGCRISFAQNDGVVLDRALEALARLGLLHSIRVQPRMVRVGLGVASSGRCRHVYVSGRMMNSVALLGRVRPSRLLAKFDVGSLGRLEARAESQPVTRVGPPVREEIAKITTSTGTMIVEGYPMHNCDEAWALVATDAIERSGATARGFSLATLQADLAAL